MCYGVFDPFLLGFGGRTFFPAGLFLLLTKNIIDRDIGQDCGWMFTAVL
jgi:hypothetical protein